MQAFNNVITLLGQENLGEAITVITALAGFIVVALRFMFKVIIAQNMSEIEKVLMNRKQRTSLKLMDIFMVVVVLGMVNIVLMLIHDDMISALLALGAILAFLLIFAYCAYRFIHFIWCKIKKTDKKWKCHNFMEEMLFVCEFLIGAEIGKVTYYNTQGLWKGIFVCLMAASVTAVLMVISVGYLEDGPSRVFFYGKGGEPIYIFYKLEDDFLLCGDDRDMKKAKISLISFDNFKKGNHKLVIEESDK